jgi:transcriptional antiterminator RfaH
MPILRKEPDTFPDELFDHPPRGDETHAHWWVVHTLPRQEKTLARKLRIRGIRHYLPQAQKKSNSPGGRLRVSYVPLFAGYVFLYASEQERLQSLDSGCIAKMLPVGDEKRLTDDLRQIRKLIASNVQFNFEPRLEPGMAVRVKTGPFQGFEGQVLKRHSGDRLLVIVNYLQQGISVALDDCSLEKI